MVLAKVARRHRRAGAPEAQPGASGLRLLLCVRSAVAPEMVRPRVSAADHSRSHILAAETDLRERALIGVPPAGGHAHLPVEHLRREGVARLASPGLADFRRVD